MDQHARTQPDKAASNRRSARPLELPSRDILIEEMNASIGHLDPVRRYQDALKSGKFVHPDGRSTLCDGVWFQQGQAALLHHLCQRCPAKLSLEIGFGMGSSALISLTSRQAAGKPFEHLVYDPFGLGTGSERGALVQAYLEQEFGPSFSRIWEHSQVGLGELISVRGTAQVGLIVIDGDHHFENVLADFVLSDLLCAKDGYIVMDDADFPAIEAAVNYIRTNRPDYAVAHLPVENTTVLQKIAPDRRAWDTFTPFKVPDRCDWTSRDQ